ncbi:MAG: DNA-binding response regulator [Deltaproteobacteria bacterium]|nr:MAG: DNA-binding response regulator [Deltaproteobacteria bacterium]
MGHAELGSILIVDDEPDLLRMLARLLSRKAGLAVCTAESANAALELLAHGKGELPEAVLTDIKMPGMDGLEFLERIQELDSTLTTVIMSGFGTVEMAVQALKQGVYDFIEKPFDNERLISVVRRAIERTSLLRENRDLQHRLGEARFCGFVGRSPRLREMQDLLRRIASSSTTVLIRGESGTGKELAARALHNLSDRSDKPMITVNCPALPEQILESELFGFRRGAFTGANHDKKGLFVEADGSTLLLDEVADIPVSIQTKLLRVLQEKEVQPLGQTRTMKVDVRVIASTNQDLEAKIRRGEFRKDLFYRLNVVTVTCPSLSEIWQDIPLLAQHFLARYRVEHQRPHATFSPEALQYMVGRRWQGNVRELQNTINRAVLLANHNQISPDDLAVETPAMQKNQIVSGIANLLQLSYREAKEQVLGEFTRNYLREALQRSGGNISQAARDCGMERQALQRLLRRHQVTAEKKVQ